MDVAGITHTLGGIMSMEKALLDAVAASGHLALPLLAAIIFAECGILPLAFLPGDSLIFATGALISTGAIDHTETYAYLMCAALLGYVMNYFLGRRFGEAVARRGKVLIIKDEHVRNARAFCERWGWWAIALARFVPFVRTFAPFVAGMAFMPLPAFMVSNVVGTVVWIGLFLELGRLFGHLPFIKEHLPTIILVTAAVWIIPPLLRLLVKRIRRA